MNINDLFKYSHVDFDKLIDYGFIKNSENYIYEKIFLDDFKAYIKIDSKGVISGKVIELDTNLEYNNIYTNASGSFVSSIRNKFIDILNNIKNNCFINDYFISNQANRISNYIIFKYNNYPEFLWDKYPHYGVFRCKSNKKWYAIIMNVDRKVLDNCLGEVNIINIKVDKNDVDNLLKNKGYYQAYHMNKKYWVSIVLDDTLDDKKITNMIDESYRIISSKE